MKKINMVAGALLIAIATWAQPPQPPTIEERLKRTHEILQKEIQPTASQKTVIEQAYKKFFTRADQLRKDNPPPDPKIKEAMDKLVKERDESIKKVLSAAQYRQYEEAAKRLQPPKPGASHQGGAPPQR